MNITISQSRPAKNRIGLLRLAAFMIPAFCGTLHATAAVRRPGTPERPATTRSRAPPATVGCP